MEFPVAPTEIVPLAVSARYSERAVAAPGALNKKQLQRMLIGPAGWILLWGWLVGPLFAQTYANNGDPQLGALVEEALDRNPRVSESLARYRAALQRIPQARALPDPVVGATQYVRTPETRVGPQTTMLSVSQRLPWFGKLGDQAAVAAKEAESMREMYEAQRADVIRQVKLAYYDLAYVDRSMAVTREDLGLLENYETLAQTRYAQGIGLQQAVVKMQAEITRDRNRLETLSRLRVDAEAALNKLLDHPPETPISQIPLGTRPQVELPLEQLYAVGRKQKPDVSAAFFQIERNEKKLDLARRQYWPDFTLGAGLVNVGGRHDPAGVLAPPPDNGKNIYSFSVSLNLPLSRRKYDAGVSQATEELLASREAYRDVVNETGRSIRSIEFRIQTIREQISLFEGTLLPQAEQSLRSAEAAYTTGQLGVLDLLDSERLLLEVQLQLAQLNSDYMKSLAEMERAIGAPFPEIRP
jgi:outer membrane protein, heavy metal efflux system